MFHPPIPNSSHLFLRHVHSSHPPPFPLTSRIYIHVSSRYITHCITLSPALPPLHFRFSCTPAARSYRNRIPVASHAHTPRLLLLHISVSISISLILCVLLLSIVTNVEYHTTVESPSIPSSPLTAHDCNAPVRPLVSLVLVFFSLSSFLSEYLWFGCIYATHRQLVSILGSLLFLFFSLVLVFLSSPWQNQCTTTHLHGVHQYQ